MPDLGTTEQMVADKLERELRSACRNATKLNEFLNLLCHEDFEKLVVDSDLKSLMPALNAFLEQINEEIGMACVASDLFRLIFESRGKG